MRQTKISLHAKKVKLNNDYPVYIGYVKITHYTDENKSSYSINPNPIMRLTKQDALQDAQAIKDSLN